MKKSLLILTAVIGLLAIGAFIFDAMQPKKERRILIEENYVPPAERPAQSAPDLTPLPE